MGFYISDEDWDKIIHYAKGRVEQNGDEVGGMAIITTDKEGDYIIEDPVILTQETTAGTCTMEKEALADYYVEMGIKYGKDVHFLWWHSHAKMSAFWSGTDTSTMEEFKSADWSAFLVVNIKEEHKFSVRYWSPIDTLTDVKLGRLGAVDEDTVPEAIMNELEAKCTKKTFSKTTTNAYGYSYYNEYYTPAHDKQLTVWNKAKKVAGDLSFAEVCSSIEPLIDGYVDGSIKKRAYNIEIKKLNKLLTTARSKYRVKTLTAQELDDSVLYMWPADLVVDENGEDIKGANDITTNTGWGSLC